LMWRVVVRRQGAEPRSVWWKAPETLSADGRPGPSWTVPSGTPGGPSRVLRAAEGGAGRLLSVREVIARLGVSTARDSRFPQRHHWIHLGRSPSRNVASGNRNHEQNQRHH